MLQIVVWVALAVACLLIGKEISKLIPRKKTDKNDKHCAVFELVAKLKDLTVNEVCNRLKNIHDTAEIVRTGNEVAIKELQATYEKVLASKLTTVEGAALISAKLASAEKAVADVAKVTLAVAALLPK